MKIRYGIPLLALLLAACASTGKNDDTSRPSWTEGNSERYPQAAWLTGVGSADSANVASDRARAELAKIFRVEIQETATDEQRYQQENESSEFSAELHRDLTTRTEQVLEGVRIGESWRNPETGRYYALAVLNRARAAAGLREDINALDASTDVLLNRARVADDAFARAQLALEVVAIQRRRGALQDMLQAIDSTGRGVTARWFLPRLEADLRTALSRITLQAKGEAPWRSMLAGQLADSGFDVSDAGEYSVQLDVRRDVTHRDGWYWARGTAVLDVESPDGQSLGQQRWTFKESATDRETAERRFEEALAARLGSEGRDAILEMVRD